MHAKGVATYEVAGVVERLRHAKRRVVQTVSWARAVNEVWRAFNRHDLRQEVADSPASQAAHVYERSTLDAQIMMVIRLFDRPGGHHVMVQNRVSFPVCRDLLAIPKVLDHLLDESEGWNDFGVENRNRIAERHRAFLDALCELEHETSLKRRRSLRVTWPW